MANVRMIKKRTRSRDISFYMVCHIRNRKVYSQVSGFTLLWTFMNSSCGCCQARDWSIVVRYDGYALVPTGFVGTLTLLILGLYNAGVDMEMPFCSKNRDAISQVAVPERDKWQWQLCSKLESFNSQLFSSLPKAPRKWPGSPLRLLRYMYHFKPAYHHRRGSLYSATNRSWSTKSMVSFQITRRNAILCSDYIHSDGWKAGKF